MFAFKHRMSIFAALKVSALSLYGLLVTGSVMAAIPLNIPDTPLFLNVAAKPNLIMAIDDSGSMDGEMLLPTNDGAAWWRTSAGGGCPVGFTGCGRDAAGENDVATAGAINFFVNGGASGTWKKYIYLFPNGSGSVTQNRRRYTDSGNDHYAVPPLAAYAWTRSPEFNAMYFDPAESYPVWENNGTYVFDPSPPDAAPWDPVYGGAGDLDLTQNKAGNSSAAVGATCSNAGMPGAAASANHTFRMYTGMVIPAGSCIRVDGWSNWLRVGHGATPTGDCVIGGACPAYNVGTSSNQNPTIATGTSVAIVYFPATVFLRAATGGIAGYTATPAADGRAPDGTVLYRYEIKSGNFANSADYDAAIQNFANWFTYYRKRHIALRAGLGIAFDGIAGMRIGGFRINDNSANATMRDIDNATDKQSLYHDFYYSWTDVGGTPNKEAVANIIRNFRRTDASAPITSSCQRNYGMLFTDGFSNPGNASSPGNVDGDRGAPYADAVDHTMADHVMRAYDGALTPLRTGGSFPVGRVVAPPQCGTPGQMPWMDCNTNLHMNFYAITLGSRGIAYNPDSPANPYVTAPTWPTTFPARHPSAVDDIWHATINGRGALLNASRATDLANSLRSVLNSIASAEGSASAAAVNSGSINTDTRIFQASFSTSDWSGSLRAFSVMSDDPTTTTVNEEGDLDLDHPVFASVPATREILTINSNGAGVPFVWGSLDATRQAALGDATTGPALASYIRANRLGDIVNSAPVFVGAPPFRYPDNLVETVTASKPYSAFRVAQASRQSMLYVGANDGMLHAFSIAPGANGAIEEAFAYVPGAVYANLPVLDDPPPAHKFFVDGTPSMVDAFFSGDANWHSVLVGGLNSGGKGIYALDVTDPVSVTESSAGTKVLWEITDASAGFGDMGFTYSRPTIARLKLGSPAVGKWVAIFGNGYDSATNKAVLYIVDVETGALLKSIDVSTTPGSPPDWRNGLSSPAVVDLNGDTAADYIYAGDLYGNMWKFDVTGLTTASWDVAYRDSSTSAPVPLFSAGTTQPITVRPQVAPGRYGAGMVVLFGTGKFIEQLDRTSAGAATQAFYGIYDTNTAASTAYVVPALANLQAQTVTGTYTVAGSRVRTTSANDVGASKRGWYMELPVTGERQVSDPVLRNARIVFTTTIPSTDECSFGGSSWLMDIDALTGKRLSYSPIDVNQNGIFDVGDLVDTNSDGIGDTPISGIANDEIMSRAAFVSSQEEGMEYSFTTDTGGDINTSLVNPGPAGVGRQSWRQLR